MARTLIVVMVLAAVILIPAAHAQTDTGPYIDSGTLGRGLVRSVAWSPQGDVIAVGGALGIWLYTPELEDIGRMTGHTRAVYDLAFSPDGAQLVSVSHDMTVRVWDLATQTELRTLEGHTDLVVAADWSHDGAWLASGGYDRTVRLWDAATGVPGPVLEGHTGWVSDVAFSPDSTMLASSSYDGTVRLWDVATGELLATMTGHEGTVSAVAWAHATGLLSAGWDGTLREWHVPAGTLAWTLQAHQDVIYDVKKNPQGPYMTASFDGTAVSWYYRDLKAVGTLTGHTGRVHKLAFDPIGVKVATLGWDDTVRVWEGFEPYAVQNEHMDWIVWVGWDQDQVRAVTQDGRLNVWDAASGAWVKPGQIINRDLPTQATTLDGAHTYELSSEGVVRILEQRAAEATVIGTLPGLANAAAWDESGTTLAVAARNGTVKLWHSTE